MAKLDKHSLFRCWRKKGQLANDSDIHAYFAGLFDGEGHISVYQNMRATGPSYPHVVIAVTNTCPEPLKVLERFYGGAVTGRTRKNPNAKYCYEWLCRDTKEMYWALTRMLPWLLIKREKAQAALVILGLSPGTGQKLNPKFRAQVQRAVNIFGNHVYVDDPERYELTCSVCGAIYKRRKTKGQTCSRHCTGILRERRKREARKTPNL